MKKKLAILIYSMAAGGAERVVSVLLPELTKHYRVTLVLMNDTVFYDIPEEVELRFLERSQPEEPGVMNLLKLPLLAWRYRRLCRKEGMEISLSFMGRPNYVNLLASMAGSGAGTIISERAMPSLQYGYPGLQSMINRRLIRLLYPVADMVVANSRGNREDLIVNFGVPAGKTVTIYNPFDLEYIREKAQKQPAIQKEGFVFATVGRIDEGKNHRMLIEAFSRLDNDMMNLWIIGDGPLREDLEKVVRQKRLEKKVRFIGRQENPFSWMHSRIVSYLHPGTKDFRMCWSRLWPAAFPSFRPTVPAAQERYSMIAADPVVSVRECRKRHTAFWSPWTIPIPWSLRWKKCTIAKH